MNIRVEWVTCRHFLLVSTWAGCQKHAQETEFVSNYSVKNVQLDLKSDRAVVTDLDKNNPLSQQHSSPESRSPLHYQISRISNNGLQIIIGYEISFIFLGSCIIFCICQNSLDNNLSCLYILNEGNHH